MEDICRLCCSSLLVHNPIFDEESALYLKMSLYLPVKVFRGDGLPQRICDKCSCKVNDIYQFCNEAIEVQNRLRAALLLEERSGACALVDLTLVKRDAPSPPPLTPAAQPVPQWSRHRATQTEPWPCPLTLCAPAGMRAPLKLEPDAHCGALVKEEDCASPPREPGPFDACVDVPSDDSDLCLFAFRSAKQEDVFKVPPDDAAADVKRERKRRRRRDASPPPAPLAPADAEDTKPLDAEPLNCCTCFARFYSQADMIDHYKAHAQDAISAASPAPTLAPAVPDDAADADGQARKCARCGQVFARQATMEKHMRWHAHRDRRPYRCALCEKTFKEAREIMKHSFAHRWHAGGAGGAEGAAGAEAPPAPADKRFMCDLCPERFVYMRYLVAHRGAAHPDARSPLVHRCVQCVREFAHLNSLRRHLRSHNGERNFLCNVCGKALTSREHLKYHIRIHTGHKPHACRTCGKAFVKKCNLTLHERVHSGEKPHVCSHCGKAFSQRSTLVIHERYHSGARPYVCSLCGRGFVARGLLSVHLKTTCI